MPDSVEVSSVPLVASVLLLSHNQCHALRRALKALEVSEARATFEILIVDCASTDGSSTIDQEFPDVHVMRLPHHIGAGRAFNIGVRTAKTDRLLFLSPNVEVAPTTVTDLIAALDQDADVAAICPRLDGIDNVLRMPDPANPARLPGTLEAGIADIACATLDAVMVRKSFIVAMNYFDQRYGHAWIDAELAMQIRKAGKKLRFYPEIHATYHAAVDPLDGDSLAWADQVNGAAEFAAKYGGSGFGVRRTAAFAALGRFDLGGFMSILGGSKLDGGQA
jgi:GT2 family glycosyltransferase